MISSTGEIPGKKTNPPQQLYKILLSPNLRRLKNQSAAVYSFDNTRGSMTGAATRAGPSTPLGSQLLPAYIKHIQWGIRTGRNRTLHSLSAYILYNITHTKRPPTPRMALITIGHKTLTRIINRNLIKDYIWQATEPITCPRILISAMQVLHPS